MSKAYGIDSKSHKTSELANILCALMIENKFQCFVSIGIKINLSTESRTKKIYLYWDFRYLSK